MSATALLVDALRGREELFAKAIDRFVELVDSTGDHGPRSRIDLENEAYELRCSLREAVELVRCLRRLVQARTVSEIHQAFGAPGDFGYDTPIGDGLAQLYRASSPPVESTTEETAAENAPTKRDVQLGPELFRFESMQQWVDKGRSWYATCGYTEYKLVTIDAVGRIVKTGYEFMRARDEGTYPISVYPIDPKSEPSEALAVEGMRREVELRTTESSLRRATGGDDGPDGR